MGYRSLKSLNVGSGFDSTVPFSDGLIVEGSVAIGTSTPSAAKLAVQSSDPRFRIIDSDDINSYTEIRQTTSAGNGTLTINCIGSSSSSLIDINPLVLSNSNASTIRFFRSTNTTSTATLQVFKGDGTATVSAQISGNNVVHSYVCANGGNFGIATNSPTSHTLQVNGSAGFYNSTTPFFQATQSSNNPTVTIGNSSSTSSIITLQGSSTSNSTINFNDSSSNKGIIEYNQSSNYMSFQAEASEMGRISTTGWALGSGFSASQLLHIRAGNPAIELEKTTAPSCLTYLNHANNYFTASTSSFGFKWFVASVGPGTGVALASLTDAGLMIGSGDPSGSRIHTLENNNFTLSAGILIQQSGTGDANLSWLLTAGQTYRAYIDNADSDIWKLDTSTVTAITTNDAGQVNFPNTSAFSAYLSADQDNVTGDGSVFQIVCDTELFDNNSNYDNATGIFTAPVDGIYFFYIVCYLDDVASGHTAGWFQVITTSDTFRAAVVSPAALRNSASECQLETSLYVKMDAGDTATFTLEVLNSTKTIDVLGISGGIMFTYCGGHLVC